VTGYRFTKGLTQKLTIRRTCWSC